MPATADAVSRTARLIAIGRAAGWAGIADPLVERCLGSADRAAIRFLRRAQRQPWLAVPTLLATGGITIHAALRMDAVDRAVLAALDGGCGQVAVLGAGFDTRAWRMDRLRGLRVVEVDLPAIQRHKRRRLGDLPPMGDVTFVEADLARDPLAEVLATTPLDDTIPTAFVWEAVAPYLPDRAVRSTAAAIAQVGAPGSRLAMTFAHPLPGPPAVAQAAQRAVQAGFRMLGEPLRSFYDDWDLIALLESAGFERCEVSVPDDWAREAGVPLPTTPFAVERLATAVSGGSA